MCYHMKYVVFYFHKHKLPPPGDNTCIVSVCPNAFYLNHTLCVKILHNVTECCRHNHVLFFAVYNQINKIQINGRQLLRTSYRKKCIIIIISHYYTHRNKTSIMIVLR